MGSYLATYLRLRIDERDQECLLDHSINNYSGSEVMPCAALSFFSDAISRILF